MKKTLIASLFSICAVLPVSAVASGIPVVDVAHIAKTVVSYNQQLKDYAEAVTQTALADSQLVQMYQDYSQVLTEYNHYLNQINSLKDQISGTDWDFIMQSVVDEWSSYDLYDFGVIPQMDPSSATFDEDLRTILEEYGLAPRATDAVITDFEVMGVADAGLHVANMETANQIYTKYANQNLLAAHNETQLKKLTESRVRSQTMLNSLGDESDLATLQFLATQNQMLSEQLSLLTSLVNQQIAVYEPPSVETANSINAAVAYEQKRLSEATGYSISNAGYDGFSSFGL
jgi:hypothetical protein